MDGGKRRANLTPFYNGFNGSIVQGETSKQWLIKGCIERLSPNRIRITEIPVGYNLKGYLKVLDKLEDDKHISSYVDKSEDDEFLFDLKIPSKIISALSDEQLLVKLKLVKTITENYTVINQHNKIEVFDNVDQLADAFLIVKNHFIF